MVYCGGSDPSFFDQLSESLTQAISSENTTELDKVLKVGVIVIPLHKANWF